MKVSRLAREINIPPSTLYKDLVQRGLKIASVEHPIDSISADAIKKQAASSKGLDLDGLFGPIRDEFINDVEDTAQLTTYRRREHDASGADAFELAVGNKIRHYFPNSHLSSVFIFNAEKLGQETGGKHGYELDHLIHIKEGDFHRLLLIECKNQRITPEKNKPATISLQDRKWYVHYSDGPKEVKKQMWKQAQAVLQVLKPIPEINLQIEAIAVSSDDNSEDLDDKRGQQDPRVIYRTMKWGTFECLLQELAEQNHVLRISQSELMRRLRQGMPCQQLGHPDIRDAIEYHRRVRLTLDFGLFKHFEPKNGKWAINGTAGMGKSVLLAYAACVFCTDHEMSMSATGKLSLKPFAGDKKGIPELKNRRIVVFSLKEKQKRIVEYYWRILIDIFQEQDIENRLRIQRPEISLWQPGQEIKSNIVLIDEGHDLNLMAQEKIAHWLNEDPDNRYFVIACDRHQKLRLIDDSSQERMISGLHFGGCTKKLKRVYRNPFSVYAAGLALMFRWFAPTGAKVVPNISQLEDAFGFDVVRRDVKEGGLGCQFEMIEDAHPANNWHHCVSDFPDSGTAHGWLDQYNLTTEDVLWVRFSQEDPDFDYELLQEFQYHNLHTEESTKLIDKYIKGQEFPIVIIEGVGSKFNDLNDPEGMFVHRRELYLCASRATVFLFFIHKSETVDDQSEEIAQELTKLRKELCRPRKETISTQFWGLEFQVGDGIVPLTQFEDLVDPIDVPEEIEKSETAASEGAASETKPNPNQKEDTDIEANTRQSNPPKSPEVASPTIRDRRPINANAIQALRTTPSKSEEPTENDKLHSKKDLTQQPPSNKKGYTLLESYTPKRLAEYLDIKPFKLVKTLMDLPEDRDIYSMNEPIRRKIIVEEVCRIYKQPAPWAHPKLGLDIPVVKVKKRIVSTKNLENIIRSGYKRSGDPENLHRNLSELGALDSNEDQTFSAFQLYVILKELNLDPDVLLMKLSAAKSDANKAVK